MSIALKIINVGTGPFKIKFLPKTPRNIQEQLRCRLGIGEGVTIPSTLIPYIDKLYLMRCRDALSSISVQEVKSEASAPVNPVSLPKTQRVKKDKKVDDKRKKSKTKPKAKENELIDKAPKGKGAKTQQGGD